MEELLGPELTRKVTFHSAAKGMSLVEYYLEHPLERQAAWEQEREAITEYTYTHLAQRMLAAL